MSMRINTVVRTIVAVFAAVAIGVGVAAAPAAAAPAPAAAEAGDACVFKLVSLTALNLLRDGRTDFVFIKLDQTFFPAGGNGVAFQTADLGVPRSAGSFGNPVMGFGPTGLPQRLVFDLFPFNHSIVESPIPCRATDNGKTTFDDGDAVYEMRYTVTV